MRVIAKDGTAWRVRRWSTADGRRSAVRRNETGDKFTDDYVLAQATPGILIARILMAAGNYVVSLFLIPVCLAGARAWSVTAKQSGRSRRTHVWLVKGNRESRELAAQVASALQHGRRLSSISD